MASGNQPLAYNLSLWSNSVRHCCTDGTQIERIAFFWKILFKLEWVTFAEIKMDHSVALTSILRSKTNFLPEREHGPWQALTSGSLEWNCPLDLGTTCLPSAPLSVLLGHLSMQILIYSYLSWIFSLSLSPRTEKVLLKCHLTRSHLLDS